MRALLITSLVLILSSCANTTPEPKNTLTDTMRGSWKVYFDEDAPYVAERDLAKYLNERGVFQRLHFQEDGKMVVQSQYEGNFSANYHTNEDTLFWGGGDLNYTLVYYPSEYPVSFRWHHEVDTLTVHLLPID